MKNLTRKIKTLRRIIFPDKQDLPKIEVDWDPYLWTPPKGKKLIVGTHSGRSGLRWLAMVHASHPGEYNLSEPYPVLESYFRYVTWNKLPIDNSGFFGMIQAKLMELWKNNDRVFYASPWLGFGLKYVHSFLKPDDYVFMIRKPEEVVNSLTSKGWYKNAIIRQDQIKVTGIQPSINNLHHQFSRITPFNDEFEEWNQLTPIGKASWFWNTVNNAIYSDLQSIGHVSTHIIRLEDIDQNYSAYCKYGKSLNLQKTLSKRRFLQIKKNIPNAAKTRRNIKQWNDLELLEFKKYANIFELPVYSKLETTIT